MNVPGFLNFVVTNCIPRRSLTRMMGRLSKVEHPWVRGPSIALWRAFCSVDLSDAEAGRFRSLHAAFTRRLAPGARVVEAAAGVLVSPCDGMVMAGGPIEQGELLQAKGRRYSLGELLVDPALAAHYAGGTYVTLRLTAGMYHRFHAPHDCRITQVTYVAGDVWNVNPPTLLRVDRLYCRNERAVIRARLEANDDLVTLVPVAAVLVASIRLEFADVTMHLRYKGPNEIRCATDLKKGEELGWFEHGSTIIVLAPRGYQLAACVHPGTLLRMGQGLMKIP
jgi:phosphatidylserine decarboxylase